MEIKVKEIFGRTTQNLYNSAINTDYREKLNSTKGFTYFTVPDEVYNDINNKKKNDTENVVLANHTYSSEYTENDLLRLAKRFNNKKRSYLLVDPLQAKHMPVSPTRSLEMMTALGNKIAELYPDTRLVIGFAETATAVGAAAASCISDECIYINTTREKMEGINEWTEFLEEHSHAAEQKLYSGNLNVYLAATNTVVLVDDEFSTGKTLLNIINNLKEKFPDLHSKKIVAASIINRVSNENKALLQAEGVECISLLHIQNQDYESAVADIEAYEAETVDSIESDIQPCACYSLPDTRLGVNMKIYSHKLNELCSEFISSHRNDIYGKVLVMGTEEFMYPSIVLGKMIEDMNITSEVRCHSTTRSPIAVSKEKNYPIRSGNIIHSFYEEERCTFIYNIAEYDTAIIFTDSALSYRGGLNDIVSLLKYKGCSNILLIKGENDVQHI